MIQTAQQKNISEDLSVLYMSFELSHNKWKLAFGTGGNPRIVQIDARDLKRLGDEIVKAKRKFGLAPESKVICCYEAGRDGFWIHRYLESIGHKNLVVDSSSIEVNRRKRRAKTDRIDAGKLYTMLVRHIRGEKHVWSVVRVPSRQDEDERRQHRETSRLQKEMGAHNNRIKSLLVTQGIVADVNQELPKLLEEAVLWDGSHLSEQLKSELLREYARWEIAREQLHTIRKEQHEQIKAAQKQGGDPKSSEVEKKLQMVVQLMLLCGIGERSAWPLVYEFLWRDFENRRQVGSAAGLCGTPYDSGESTREQGISKAGNKCIRSLMVELSWFWLRYQPESTLTKWFNERFGHGGKRMRRIGIVAVARKLLITLWRYSKFGEIPEGARFKSTTIAA